MQIFRQAALEVAERVLGQLDRRPDSPTAGCFDRSYWCYCSVDFASSWFNNATEYVALLAHLDERPWQSPRLGDWARSAIAFSLSLAHRDGSVSEAYPNEHGFCATAFLCAHLAAATALVGSAGDPRLGAMAHFLATDHRAVPANQRAAAALALLRVARLLGHAVFAEAARGQLLSLAAEQDAAGGFREYDGADVGYQTVTLSALAQIESENLAEIEKSMVGRALEFLDRAVGADGAFDYRQGSRRAQFLYPFGLAYYRSPVLARLVDGLVAGTALRPAWLDDRYVADLAIDHLRTYLHARDGRATT
jgi:hypothetical protein